MYETEYPYQDTQRCKGTKVMGEDHCPDAHHASTCYAADNSKPYHTFPGILRLYLLEFTMGHPTRTGELLQSPQDPIVLLPARPMEMYYIWNGAGTMGKRGEGAVLVWHIPQSISSCLTVLPSLALYGIHSQVKFPNFPTSPSSRPDGLIRFPLVPSFPPLAWST